MARYILIATVVGQPPGWTYTKWGRGRTIADTAGNALPGDVLCLRGILAWLGPMLGLEAIPNVYRPMSKANDEWTKQNG